MKKLIASVFAAAVLFWSANYCVSGTKSDLSVLNFNIQNLQVNAPAEISRENVQYNTTLFIYLLLNIKNYYYKDVDLDKCTEQILTGGIPKCTDPYSFYLNAKELEEEQAEMIKGEFAGIGARLEADKDGKGVKIISVYENSPAEKAGLVPGNIITAVSTQTVKPSWIGARGMPLDAVVKLIRGPAGTSVMLKILSKDKEKELTVVRNLVKIEFLETKRYGETGYIRIQEFAGDSLSRDFYEKVGKLKSEGIRILIIDLRYNPGGRVDQVAEIASQFAPKNKNTILLIKSRGEPIRDMVKSGRHAGSLNGLKIIVLQNEYSASASEILSGYLQSECGAVVIGKTSFGKGIMQSLIPIPNGGELHLTTAEYFIGAKMVKVHEIGIKPQIEIENPKDLKDEASDQQLQKALNEAKNLIAK